MLLEIYRNEADLQLGLCRWKGVVLSGRGRTVEEGPLAAGIHFSHHCKTDWSVEFALPTAQFRPTALP